MKIGFLITARLKSSRLPLKLLEKIDGKELITQVIHRIKELNEVEEVVLCTSTNPQDKTLVEIAEREGIDWFTGNEEDVLQRLLDAATLHNLDYLIGITGENPLFSIEHTNKVIDLAKKGEYDFISPKGLPIGCATYALKIDALKLVCKVKEEIDTEIWGYLINRPEIFNNYFFEVEEPYYWPDLRITIDYPEDLQFVKEIFEKTTEKERLNLGGVLDFLRKNPELPAIHNHRVQLDLDEEVKEKINAFYKKNLESVLKEKEAIYAK